MKQVQYNDIIPAQFKDIILGRRFISDWENAPPRTQKRVDKIIKMIAVSGKLPNSLNAHRTDQISNLWIGYVNVTRAHYRLLFTWNASGEVIFLRLLTHNQQDALLNRTNIEDRIQLIQDYM